METKVLRPCPKCGVELDGGTIPEAIREHYSEPYRWGREIYCKEYLPSGDKKRYYMCPDCKETIIPPK